MQLTVWTYEAPPHVGAMRIATAMRGVHYVLHAPQGDTYADLLFTMIERRERRPPVTYTTFQARDLGGDTATLFQDSVRDAYSRFQPQLMLVGASCTAELIQDDPGGLAQAVGLPIPVIPLELPAYQKKENWGASETFYRIVRALVRPAASEGPGPARGEGATELQPVGPDRPWIQASRRRTRDHRTAGEAGCRRKCRGAARRQPRRHRPTWATPTSTSYSIPRSPRRWRPGSKRLCASRPCGPCRSAIAPRADSSPKLPNWPASIPPRRWPARRRVSPWYSKSVNSTYLTGKRVFIFGDATHALAAARVATQELGFTVVGLGTYSREFAREVRQAASELGLEALITDDYLEVEASIAGQQPELVLGTQMERHIAKRLGIPCAVISSPVHVQDFPARYSPQMGFEGANVIFDTWIHPLMMGLEEHLLSMFREDFEFHDGVAPSHLGSTHGASPDAAEPAPAAAIALSAEAQAVSWTFEAESELRKIPFFVRGKAKRNTERFAGERGVATITVETLYDAKAHYGR